MFSSTVFYQQQINNRGELDLSALQQVLAEMAIGSFSQKRQPFQIGVQKFGGRSRRWLLLFTPGPIGAIVVTAWTDFQSGINHTDLRLPTTLTVDIIVASRLVLRSAEFGACVLLSFTRDDSQQSSEES